MKITVKKATDADVARFKSMPTWGCPPSKFDWYYPDTEIFLVLEGEVAVTYDGGSANFGPGDLVTCPAGLSCVWYVKSSFKKHYEFI